MTLDPGKSRTLVNFIALRHSIPDPNPPIACKTLVPINAPTLPLLATPTLLAT